MSKGLKYVFFAFCWSVVIVVLSSCRMPDMFSVNPYFGDTEMEQDNGLNHNEWGVGLSFTWDLNPERYSNPQAIPHPGYLILNPDGTYWPKELLTPEKNPEEAKDTERVKDALEALGLEDQVREETE